MQKTTGWLPWQIHGGHLQNVSTASLMLPVAAHFPGDISCACAYILLPWLCFGGLSRVVVPNAERGGIQFNAINFELLRTDAGLRQQHLDYLQLLGETDFTTLPQNEAVAFLINAYNAFATDLIVKENPPASIMDLSDGRGSVFSWATWPMTKGGQVVQASLDAVEHQFLRMEVTGWVCR